MVKVFKLFMSFVGGIIDTCVLISAKGKHVDEDINDT